MKDYDIYRWVGKEYRKWIKRSFRRYVSRGSWKGK